MNSRVFITSEIFYFVKGAESFPLENIDEKKYLLHNIIIDGNNPNINIKRIRGRFYIYFICNINVDDNSPLSILMMLG
jgi:hypothetical protein